MLGAPQIRLGAQYIFVTVPPRMLTTLLLEPQAVSLELSMLYMDPYKRLIQGPLACVCAFCVACRWLIRFTEKVRHTKCACSASVLTAGATLSFVAVDNISHCFV